MEFLWIFVVYLVSISVWGWIDRKRYCLGPRRKKIYKKNRIKTNKFFLIVMIIFFSIWFYYVAKKVYPYTPIKPDFWYLFKGFLFPLFFLGGIIVAIFNIIYEKNKTGGELLVLFFQQVWLIIYTYIFILISAIKKILFFVFVK